MHHERLLRHGMSLEKLETIAGLNTVGEVASAEWGNQGLVIQSRENRDGPTGRDGSCTEMGLAVENSE